MTDEVKIKNEEILWKEKHTLKKITFQQISKEGLSNIGPTVEKMAGAESLDAHKLAVSVRLKA